MNEEKGEAVFTDIDHVLAGKIVQHATENAAPSREQPPPACPQAIEGHRDRKLFAVGLAIGLVAGILLLTRIFRRR
jgi:hypothetical protein